ncbi:MAG: ribosomal protein L7/L12 [Candidatus Hodgkinia cicadicola]|nr:MAG: ribosomal protein L7/L12 [Candidatus Hodgkinia cicadicola]
MLKEAKDFVGNVPKLINLQLSEAEVGVLKSRFETLGAEIELR